MAIWMVIWIPYVAVAVLAWYPSYEWMTNVAPATDPEERVIARCTAALVALCWPVFLPMYGAWHLSRLMWLRLKRRFR